MPIEDPGTAVRGVVLGDDEGYIFHTGEAVDVAFAQKETHGECVAGVAVAQSKGCTAVVHNEANPLGTGVFEAPCAETLESRLM